MFHGEDTLRGVIPWDRASLRLLTFMVPASRPEKKRPREDVPLVEILPAGVSSGETPSLPFFVSIIINDWENRKSLR